MSILTSHPNQSLLSLTEWKITRWEDYETYRDRETRERVKLYYSENHLFVEMGSEGINHSSISDL